MSKLSRTVVLLVWLSACGNPVSKPDAPAPPALPAVPKPPPPTPTAATDAKPPSADALPVPEDFEAEAETAISKASYKKELDALDREIEADAKADRPLK